MSGLQRMSVPEAMEAIKELWANHNDMPEKTLQKILDAMWMQAYDEGEAKVFSPPEDSYPKPTNNKGVHTFMRTQKEEEGIKNIAAFMQFLAEIGAHCVVEMYTTIHSTLVDYNCVVVKECAPVVVQQIAEHFQVHAISIVGGKGFVVNTAWPKKGNAQ